ncbi:MAG: hypothetical protein CH6_1035 [Candidatus Kapaibacterium sp.]|nr:MAG: hypothetical protein CH6_1035 [Candidatus Kapabacteria bacterium]
MGERLKRLEPTYKELKHKYRIKSFKGYTGLEPTYKELKPGLQSNGLPPQKRLEPTYKELKLESVRNPIKVNT